MKKSRRKAMVTAELCESMALTLRGTKITRAFAEALAPNLQRINDAALEAAKESDFNDEPSRFASVLAQLKTPSARR